MNATNQPKDRSFLFYTALILGITWIIEISQAESAETQISYAKNACRSSENWVFSNKIPLQWRKEFKSTSKKRSHAVRGFSEALAFRKMAFHPEGKAFAEYWISRSLFNSNLVHIAHQGFTAIASRPLSKKTLGPQLAAIECLLQIHHRYPTLSLSGRIYPNLVVAKRIKELPTPLKKVISSAAGVFLRSQIARKSALKEIDRTLRLIEENTPEAFLAQGLRAAFVRKHKKTITWMTKFLKSKRTPRTLKKMREPARLLLSRAYYTIGKYESSAKLLKGISKSSNELAHALSELSWAYLMNQQYGEAIGTTINLQSGGLRETFAPEAPMVMAIALNELCQYPESINAVNLFRNHYQESYQWLQTWYKRRNSKWGRELYSVAIQFLKEEESELSVPHRIASEWLRSPLFIARQDEINLIFRGKKHARALGKQGSDLQYQSAVKLLKFAKKFKKKYRLAKIRLKPGEKLSDSILAGLEQLKKQATHYRRLRKAAPFWRTILKNHEKSVDKLIAKQMNGINKDLRALNIRMFHQVQEVAENNYFIEVEIFNGATQDIIWQNAHPGYEKVVKELKEEQKVAQAAGQTFNWGTVSYGLDGAGEVWEDELGSFKADIYDNCSNKQKYLDLKRKQLATGEF